MTKKHYEAIAKILNDELKVLDDSSNSIAVNRAVRTIAIKLAESFKKDNLKFDGTRFFQAINK